MSFTMLWLVAGVSAGLWAQAPPAERGAPDSGVVLRSTSREVLLDMVVRDQHEKLVRNLKPSDIEVFEDGVRQKVTSFRLVSGREQLEYET